jgi:restriction endonuclease EcoRII-like protein
LSAESANVRELLGWVQSVSGADWLWDVKYLSVNDTYANPKVHQAGPYVSKRLLATAFQQLSSRARGVKNPDVKLPVSLESHDWSGTVRLVWYNTKIVEARKKGRDEARLTGWGGRKSPMVSLQAPGTLVVFAYPKPDERDPQLCRIWLCRDADEADAVLDIVGEVEPGEGILFSPSGQLAFEPRLGSCALAIEDIPPQWLREFPTGDQILEWVLRQRPLPKKTNADDRLMKRRDCETDLFYSIEAAHVLPHVKKGFESVSEFVDFAGSVLNRRKSRSGRSLELQVRCILNEESISFTPSPNTEGKRKPDLIFPDIRRYRDKVWPDKGLRMLALKTTCKDRWRQVLNEAKRIEVKHLLTLQEGVSADQHTEMEEEKVVLVVPKRLMSSYPEDVRPKLLTFEQFIAEVRSLPT